LKIILSRKGFNSSAVGCASPLLDGRPISLPIPASSPSLTSFGDLARPLPEMVRDLARGSIGLRDKCHLDPDIDRTVLRSRRKGWRGALGQVGRAQSHLARGRIQPGDMFLFWGLFRPVSKQDRTWQYAGPAVHAIFGWLQVDEVCAGKRLGHNPDTVIWAGKIKEKIRLADYWQDWRFQAKKPRRSKRPDNIYRPTAKGGLAQVPNPSHGPGAAVRDIGGQHALVVAPAWRLDAAASELPEQFSQLRLGPRHRHGHRTTEVDRDKTRELVAWLNSRKLRVRKATSCAPSWP
jgi:hypothetical protein